MNADLFPTSSNVWDSLGEAYLKSGDAHKAAECYSKSLALDPNNSNAKESLRKLKVKD